jgi:hypothetical protein
MAGFLMRKFGTFKDIDLQTNSGKRLQFSKYALLWIFGWAVSTLLTMSLV